ncbi:hypothetical protein G5C51_31650 [Streptomyces sp. A7024]|uniref:Uncharacterized protein n=1 Tax=Streptomyces coryli TaxID=1128680 RepID=A0A6G4U875_9ACTN|nr:hypothetical protein [Streptomyces coryli]NGN68439.1 hypothetical protein [Streptomyces coryli]
MASSSHTIPAGWVAAFRDPDDEMERRLAGAGPSGTVLAAAGETWDAMVIAPLERGLAALDRLDVPFEAGYGVVADYWRHELIVHVTPHAAATTKPVVQGLRTLSSGSWVLMPTNDDGTWQAACLSRPSTASPRNIDADQLRAAVLEVDAARTGHL